MYLALQGPVGSPLEGLRGVSRLRPTPIVDTSVTSGADVPKLTVLDVAVGIHYLQDDHPDEIGHAVIRLLSLV
jgi:hypothetical protein